MGDAVEEAEVLRDPSHVRNYTEAEWRGFVEEAGLGIDDVRFFAHTFDFAAWLERTGCEGEEAERVERASRRARRRWAADARQDRDQSRDGLLMAILVDNDTRLVVQGLTGSEGRFHGLRNRAYGTKLVAGVTPGKGGQDVEGVPVLDTVAEAVSEHGANTAMVFVPAPFAADAVYEAVDAGVHTVIAITEGVPAHEMLRIHAYIRARDVPDARPELPRCAVAGQGERRDHPRRDLHRRATSGSSRARGR